MMRERERESRYAHEHIHFIIDTRRPTCQICTARFGSARFYDTFTLTLHGIIITVDTRRYGIK